MTKILTRAEALHCLDIAALNGASPAAPVCVVEVRFLRTDNTIATVKEHIAPGISVLHKEDTHHPVQERYLDWEDFAQAYGLTSGHNTSTPT